MAERLLNTRRLLPVLALSKSHLLRSMRQALNRNNTPNRFKVCETAIRTKAIVTQPVASRKLAPLTRYAADPRMAWAPKGHRMRRREFIASIGAGAMLPLVARAQQSTKVYRIALLHPSHPVSELTEHSRLRYWREFFQQLRQLGYVEGHNLTVERFSGEGHVENYPKLARDVAAGNPNVVFAITIWMVGPLKEATSTIPIVAMTSDPVQLGLVASMARPGGNITGVSVDAGLELWEKRLQL